MRPFSCLPRDLPYSVLIWFGFSADGAERKRATGIRQGEVPARSCHQTRRSIPPAAEPAQRRARRWRSPSSSPLPPPFSSFLRFHFCSTARPSAATWSMGPRSLPRALDSPLASARFSGKPTTRLRFCRSGCPGSGRIFAWTRSRRSFSWWSISAARAASLYALGYGKHETAPQRVLPFYPAVPRRDEPRGRRRRRLHLPLHLGVHVAVVLGAGDGA